jgi:prepilin-type N-terminal cleavage/methylation domain-containing protein
MSNSQVFAGVCFLGQRRQRGLSLVELMVGIAVGLFVVAAASLLLSSQLNDNRRLLLELQVQQDLRATADIITREIRRAGHWAVAETAVTNPAAGITEAAANANLQLPIDAVTGSTHSVEFKYKRANGEEGPFGYKLDPDKVLRAKLTGQSGYHDLTDANTLLVDQFSITPTTSAAVSLPCPTDCPATPGAAADACWPKLSVRDFLISITGHSPTDPAIVRTVTTQVRLRNDDLVFPLVTNACPPQP